MHFGISGGGKECGLRFVLFCRKSEEVEESWRGSKFLVDARHESALSEIAVWGGGVVAPIISQERLLHCNIMI